MTDHPLPVGTPVRHIGQCWARAATATITGIKGPYNDGAYEYEVLAGEDFSRRLSDTNPQTRTVWWASYATVDATERSS